MDNNNTSDKQADFFVSFSGHDKKWADWIAWVLNDQGYMVIYQPWDFAPGSNFVIQINKAVGSTKTIAVISENYIRSNFVQPEWAAAFAGDPTGIERKLIPVRITECDLKGSLLAQIVYIDLVGIFDENIAKKTLLDGLEGKRPYEAPEYPSYATGLTPPFPGTVADPATRTSAAQQEISSLPPPGIRVPFSPAYIPPTFRGIQIHKNNPLVLDFILDSGDSILNVSDIDEVSLRLTKYFLTALTIPDDHLWVNLSPYEKGFVIPEDLSQTQMGIDLLVQDYILKQVTSTAVYPENVIGNTYWQCVYNKVENTNNLDTFNKIWVTPETARIIERGSFAIVEDSKLRVQTEYDYLAMNARQQSRIIEFDQSMSSNNKIAAHVFKQKILPLIEANVNKGGNFAVLRQIFGSLVLAAWYKEALKRSIVTELYVDKGMTARMANSSEITSEVIYQQYLKAYRVGVFNYIREEVIGAGEDDILPRKYFSGGFTGALIRDTATRTHSNCLIIESRSTSGNGKLYWVRINLSEEYNDFIDKNDYGIENVGGIDFSTTGNFELNIEREGEGLRFQLSDALIERLHQTGMGRFYPNVMFVKHIDQNRLEISDKRGKAQ